MDGLPADGVFWKLGESGFFTGYCWLSSLVPRLRGAEGSMWETFRGGGRSTRPKTAAAAPCLEASLSQRVWS